MHDIIASILRTFVAYILLLLVSLWIGKQMNSHNNLYNLALSVTIGSLVANMGFDVALKFFPMFFAFFTLVILYILVSLVSIKSRKLRSWVSGEPTVLIDSGKILDENMEKIRYSLDDLNQQLREKDIFDISEVEYALLEVSGKLSVLKKPRYQGVTKADVLSNLPEKTKLPKELIMDGKVVEKNLSADFSHQWLEKELASRSLHITDVKYAVLSSNESLFLDLYNDQLKFPVDKE